MSRKSARKVNLAEFGALVLQQIPQKIVIVDDSTARPAARPVAVERAVPSRASSDRRCAAITRSSVAASAARDQILARRADDPRGSIENPLDFLGRDQAGDPLISGPCLDAWIAWQQRTPK